MNTVMVLTSKDLNTFFIEHGCGDWKINQSNLAKCSYLITTANSNSDWSQHPKELHGNAFMVAKIIGVFKSNKNPDRLVIEFDKYAHLNLENAWNGQQNPVRYVNYEDFDLDLTNLNWLDFPVKEKSKEDNVTPLTIEEAKKGLAKKLGITVENIEIIIRT